MGGRHRDARLTTAGLTGQFIAALPSPNTREGYTRSFEVFADWWARFLRADLIPDEAMEQFLALGQGETFRVVMGWQADMLSRGLSNATVNVRLSALRSLLEFARKSGASTVTLDIDRLPDEPLRDTRGPAREDLQILLAAFDERIVILGAQARALRDGCYFLLLYLCGLRRGEVLGLDCEHVDLAGGAVHIQGKGRRDRIRIAVPAIGLEKLGRWLETRSRLTGSPSGPVFCALHKPHVGKRLTGPMVDRIFTKLSKQTGVRCRPHGLRHSAITEALARSGGNLRSVQRFSRHKNPAHIMRYDDNRTDLASDIADMLAEDLAKALQQAEPVTT